MASDAHPGAPPGPVNANAQAVFDATYYRGVLLEYAATAILLFLFYATGLSQRLAVGATRWAGGRWWLANALYLALIIVGLIAAVFPIHNARARRLARALNAPDPSDAGWLRLHARAVAADAAMAFAFFNVLYALLHWTPQRWWIVAAVLYAALAIALPEFLSERVIPRLYQPQPVPNSDLERALLEMAARVGHPLEGVGAWSEEDSPHFPDALLAGPRRRFLLLSAFAARACTAAEAGALAAREIGRLKRRQRGAQIAFGGALAGAGFAAVHYGATAALRRFGPVTIAEARDLAGFPLLALAILAASALVQPLLRAQRRGQDFAADAFAARVAGAPALLSALRRLQGRLPERPRWIEWLFDERPSLRRRQARLAPTARADD